MNIKETSNRYLLLAFISMLINPITGIFALSYAVNAKNNIETDGDLTRVKLLLKRCYKWLRISFVSFLILFPILVLLFMSLPLLFGE